MKAQKKSGIYNTIKDVINEENNKNIIYTKDTYYYEWGGSINKLESNKLPISQ